VINVNHHDNAQNKAVVFKSSSHYNATIVCLPAMGVRAMYYKKFANAFQREGFNVVLMDWRGSGSSTIRASRKTDFGYEQLINDVHDLILQIKVEFPIHKIIIVGHSLGGQVGALFASRYSHMIAALVLITACNVYFKGWPGMAKLKVLIAGVTFYPLSLLLGYFPGGSVGFGGREAVSVMKDWCSNALTGNYKLSASGFNYDEALLQLKLPVLALSIKNDRLASENAVINLLIKLKNCTVSHTQLSATNTSISPLNHFSWTKNPVVFVHIITSWLSNLSIHGKSVDQS